LQWTCFTRTLQAI